MLVGLVHERKQPFERYVRKRTVFGELSRSEVICFRQNELVNDPLVAVPKLCFVAFPMLSSVHLLQQL